MLFCFRKKIKYVFKLGWSEIQFLPMSLWRFVLPLFVFSICDRKQNATSLLTPVSGPDFYALSCGTFSFALRGSFFNHFLIGWSYSTANQNHWNRRLVELSWRTNWRVSNERGWKSVSEIDVKSDLEFCLRPFIEKTNSGDLMQTFVFLH